VENKINKEPVRKCPICCKALVMKEFHGMERWACQICSYVLILPIKKIDKNNWNG
jgi:ribosomal protein S27AE